MAPVFANYSFAAGTNFISVTPVATDPSERIQAALEAWMTGMGGQGGGVGQCGLRLINSPNQCTTKASATIVEWLIQTNMDESLADQWIANMGGSYTVKDMANGGSGFRFGGRPGNSTGANATRGLFTYYTNDTGNNGAGTVTGLGSSQASQFLDLTVASTIYISYEASGSTPWFCVANPQNGTGGSAQIIAKLDRSSLPANTYTGGPCGKADWLYVHINGSLCVMFTATSSRGFVPNNTYSNATYTRSDLYPTAGYYQELGYITAAQNRKAFGRFSPGLLVNSYSSTGTYGDTVVLEGNTYLKVHNTLFVRIG